MAVKDATAKMSTERPKPTSREVPNRTSERLWVSVAENRCSLGKSPVDGDDAVGRTV
jgi:hypothetical protein